MANNRSVTFTQDIKIKTCMWVQQNKGEDNRISVRELRRFLKTLNVYHPPKRSWLESVQELTGVVIYRDPSRRNRPGVTGVHARSADIMCAAFGLIASCLREVTTALRIAECFDDKTSISMANRINRLAAAESALRRHAPVADVLEALKDQNDEHSEGTDSTES